jgi:peroxiredoxin Q/BCP
MSIATTCQNALRVTNNDTITQQPFGVFQLRRRFMARSGLFILPLLLMAIVGAVGSVFASALKEGDPAPSFTLPGSDGATYELEQFKGVKPVVIAWYPKAFTGG